MIRPLLRFLLAIPLSLLFVASASAAVVTWDGGGGADTLWSNCNNWNPSNVCPTSADTATFDATSTNNVTIATTLTGSTAPRGIDINTGYTGIITQNAGVSITVGVGNFDQAAGTFTGGDSAITINGNFILSGGTFTSTGGVLTISDSFTHTAGGTFAHNNGTVTFTGTSGTIDVNGAETLYNLIINLTSTFTKTVSDNDTLTVASVLTLTEGNLNQSIIPAAGTIVVNGSISHSANFDGGNSQVNLESSGTASFSSGFMSGFKLNSANAVATGPSSGTLTFEHHLTVADGTFNAGVGAITLSGSTKNFTQSGGTFNGGAGTVTFPGAVGISGGTFNGGTTTTFSCNSCTFTFSAGTLAPGSGTLNVATNWTQTLGTFTEGTSTVSFYEGNGSKTIDVNGTETFYNLTFNTAAGWDKTITNSETLTVSNILTLNEGSVNQTTIPAAGTIIVNGSISQNANFDGGTAQVNLESSGTVSFVSGSMTGFKVNGAGAVATGPSSGTLTFENSFIIADGTFNAGDGVVTLSSGKNFTQSGGTFNGGAGAVTFPAAVTISGGTFNGGTTTNFSCDSCTFTFSAGTLAPGSGTLNVATHWTQTSGTFTEGTSTVVFHQANGDKTIDVNATETFYNLIFNTVGTNKVVANSDTLTVSNVLTLTEGSLNQTTIPSAGTIIVNGSISQNANFDGGTAQVNLESSGTVSFVSGSMTGFKVNGAGAVATGPSSGTLTFENNLIIGDGTFNAGVGAITLSSGKNFTQSGGTFNGGAGTVTFPGAVGISGGTFNGGTTTTFSCNSCTFTFSAGALVMTTGTLNVATHWTQTLGTFTEGQSTVSFYQGNGSKTIDVNGTETFYNLNIGDVSSAGWQKTVANSDTLNVSNDLTLTDGLLNQTTIPSTGSVSVSRHVTIASGFDGGTGKLVFAGGANQNFDLTGAEGLFNGDIAVNKSGGEVDLLSALTMNSNSQDLIIQEGTFDLSGFALSVTAGATETIIVETGGNLQLQGGETITGDSASYPQLNSGSTVTYDGASGPYTIKDYTYHHLTIAGTSGQVFRSGANETIGGNLTITSGTFTTGGNTLAVTGTFQNLDTLRFFQNETFTGTMDIDSGTVEYNGDGDASPEAITIHNFDVGGGAVDFYNLKINDPNGTKDTFNIGATLTVAGTLQVTNSTFSQGANIITTAAILVDGGTLTGGSQSIQATGGVTISSGVFTSTSATLTIGGGFAHTAGTFTHNSGTVAFNNAGVTSTISGSTTFNNLTCTTANKPLTFTAGTTQTIAGLLTLTGSASNLIVLRSTVTDSVWNLIVNGTSSVDYVNVRDSNAGGGNAITHAVSPSRSVNVANNTNWSFNAAPTVASVTGVQSSTGDGDVTITFIMDDPDDDNTLQAKVEYSLDGGNTWNDPTLSTTGADTSATQGDPSINNAVTYQVGQSGAYILSSSGANTVTIVWEAATDISASTNIANARIRITPYDGTVEGTAGSSSNFILDRVAPSGLANFRHADFSSTQAVLSWTAATDTNFNHYEIWHGETESQVIARSGSAVEWDNDNDSALTTASTVTTTINNTDPRNKYFKIFAVDNYGNELTIATYYIGGGQSSGGSSSSSSSSSSSGSSSTTTTGTTTTTDTTTDATTDTTDSGSGSSPEEDVTEEETTTEEEEVVEEETEEEEETSGTTWEDFDIQPEEGHWSEGYVKYLEEETNIVEVAVSQPTFLEILLSILETPNEPMPRGNALEFLLVLAGYQLDTMAINVRAIAFEDVSLDDDQAGFIQFAYDQRLVQGYPDGTFQPDRVVNRAEALKLCSYFFEGDWTHPVYGDELLDLYELSENPFTDVDLDEWYAPYLINAYAKGVVNGYGDGTFGPGNAVTYAEFLKIATLMQNIEEAVELADELE